MAEEYLKLSQAARAREASVAPVLAQLAQEALSPSLESSQRSILVSRLLEDLSLQKWSEQTTCAAVLALKMLGRSANGSEELASEKGMTVLLKRASVLPIASGPPKALPASSLEALRCLCNVLLLSEASRDVFEGISGAVEGIVGFLTDPAPISAHFLAARMLFLLTAKGGDVNRALVEDCQLSERLAEALSRALKHLQKPIASEMQDRMSALGEHLKLLFNIVNFYPRLLVVERNGDTSRPGSPASLKSPVLGESPKIGSSGMKRTGSAIKDFFSSRSRTTTGSRPSTPSVTSPRTDGASPLTCRGFPAIVSHLVSLALCLPMPANDHLPSPPLSHALHALTEFTMSDIWLATPAVTILRLRDPLPVTSASDPSGEKLPTLPPLVARLLSFLDIATAHFCPGLPDSEDTLAKIRASVDVDVDAGIASLLLLLRKVVIGDATGLVQKALAARLLADDIDRTQPLDQRTDLTGRLVRLMSAVYLQNTKVGASEFLFALCGQDPALLSRTIGWGNAAGFLTSNNLAFGPAEAESAEANGDARVNPVTGAFFDTGEPAGANMTEDEKLAEAERLMVLFDRLGKTGVVKVGNPMQQAQETGRFETIDDEPEEIRQKEEQEEQEALDELRRYKERKERLKSNGP